MAEQPDRPAPAPVPPPVPAPSSVAGSVPPWQGPRYTNTSAAAAGAGMRVESEDLQAAARALAARVEQSAAAAGLRVEPRAAGHPNAATALTALADGFHIALTAFDADRGAAVGNLQASARIYESVEVRVRDDLLNTLDHSPIGRTGSTPGGPTLPTQGPSR